ncbi:phosphonate ABC transporter ATP-binding protein [Geoalkalibacter sp.]|uniref:phosphonate ABC transporter ATP-binding protein n=1 Tax=Geoalkalibacter sp. TaxID=3041440 RepID=UPI00272EB778|nr:ATP-binding cassette domain-containing protein [Geoalkalibacter sp.]
MKEAGEAEIFALRGVGKSFGDTPVLKDLSFCIAAGERLAVIGPSGAGKTTLFRLLSAVLKPTTGEVRALGQDTRRLRGRALHRLRRDIGVLYQNDNLIAHLRVVHNVLMGKLGEWSLARALLSLLWPQDLAGAKAALQQVELADKLWCLPGELSGGQQQRVAIARLIVQQPRVMLADEPVSQLDIRLGREIIELLCATARSLGSTLLVNLHTLELLHGNFERVIALRQGQLFWQGPPSALTRELLREIYGAEYRALHLDEVPLEAGA